MPVAYNLNQIRALLTEGFSTEELRDFCFDVSVFRPVYHQLAENTGKTRLVSLLLEHAEQKQLMQILLAWAEMNNPARYQQALPYHHPNLDSSEASTAHKEFQQIEAKFLENNLEIEPPYGTMRPDSIFYIEREADEDCWGYFSQTQAVTLFIQAPRQMGKSSLMRRTIDRAEKKADKKLAFIDFQEFPKQHFIDTHEDEFLIEFCLMIGRALEIDEAIDRYWQGRGTNIVKCGLYLSQHIIPSLDKPFILALDEVDRMLPSPFRDNFFGMLRVWHNKRAYDENFRKMSLFLSSSTESSLLIANRDQSPFNVAEHISLDDFTRPEVEALNERHHSPLNQNQIDELMALISGHPFLTRVALYQLTIGKIDVAELFDQATADTGPFGDHLRHYLLIVLARPELKQALMQLYQTHALPEDYNFHYLKGIGLIKKDGQQVVFRNNLCERYFRYHLNRL